MNRLLIPTLIAGALGLVGQESRIMMDVTRVNLVFTVTDKRGRFITDLTEEDFEVVENQRSQKISQFVAETDLPLRLGILVDTSNSVRERFKFIQEAAVRFVNSTVRAGQDKAFVMSFDTTVEVPCDLTDDAGKLAASILSLRPGRGTSLYDAIYSACRERLGPEQPDKGYRRAILLVSDGDDTQSRVARDQALEAAQKADVTLHAISTNNSTIESPGDKVLKYLSAETGGLALFPLKMQDLGRSFENMASELRHQYSICFRPEPLTADGRYHPVDLKVKSRKNIVLRVRKGYYAPKL